MSCKNGKKHDWGSIKEVDMYLKGQHRSGEEGKWYRCECKICGQNLMSMSKDGVKSMQRREN